MRPGRIEIHINRQRTRKPNSKRRKESILLGEIFAGESKRDPQRKKAIERRAKRHRHDVRFGKSIRRNVAAESVIGKNEKMGGK